MIKLIPSIGKLILASASLTLGGVLEWQEAVPFAAAQTTQVRIGIARTMSDVGYYVADAKGYFRDEGIEVTMTPFNSACSSL